MAGFIAAVGICAPTAALAGGGVCLAGKGSNRAPTPGRGSCRQYAREGRHYKRGIPRPVRPG